MSLKALAKCLFAAATLLIFTSQAFATDDVTLSDERAATLFEKFVYGERIVFPAKVWQSLGSIEFITLDDGKMASLSLFLMKNGNYLLRYVDGVSTGSGSFTYDQARDVIDLTGRWSARDGNLNLENLTRASKAEVTMVDINGRPLQTVGIFFTLSKDIKSKGLAGKPVYMVPMLSTQSM
jgi:hypothetical protein